MYSTTTTTTRPPHLLLSILPLHIYIYPYTTADDAACYYTISFHKLCFFKLTWNRSSDFTSAPRITHNVR